VNSTARESAAAGSLLPADTLTIWHSALAGATSGAAMRIRLASGVLASRYAGKPAYVKFEIPTAPGRQYKYQIENDRCAEALRSVPVGTWVDVTATGTGESAALFFSSLPRDAVQQQLDPEPAAAAAPRAQGRGSLAAEMFGCLSAAADVVERFKEDRGREPSDAELRLAASFFIEFQRSPGRVVARRRREGGAR
jgi:hypothetical protein